MPDDTPHGLSPSRARTTPHVRIALLILGFVLMLAAPVVGMLPGPGFIILFPVGLALVLRNSDWAKRRYARFKRGNPRAARWSDRVLRRRISDGPPRPRATPGERPKTRRDD